MGKKTILLGEDEKDLAEMYKIVFEKNGFNIVLAGNGKEVLEKAKEVEPDLLLLDINMPVMDGFEVLKEISENIEIYKLFENTPIIILTNYNNPQDVEYCTKRGAQDFIVKAEWSPDQVVKKVQKYLDAS
jgi:CheY-like chemotaxis protein